MKITGSQIRAARAFLDWTIAELSTAAGVSDSTIRSIESNSGKTQIVGGLESTVSYRTKARDESVEKLQRALEKAGVTFLPETTAGVGIRGKIRD